MLRRALTALQQAPGRRERPKRRITRNLRVALGPDALQRLVQDCEEGMSQDAAARKYGVSQSSVSKYVLAARGAEKP